MDKRTLSIGVTMASTTVVLIALAANFTVNISGSNGNPPTLVTFNVENPEIQFAVTVGATGTVTGQVGAYSAIGFGPETVTPGATTTRRLRDFPLVASGGQVSIKANCDAVGNCETIGTDSSRTNWGINPAMKVLRVNFHATAGDGEFASFTEANIIALADRPTPGVHADSLLAQCAINVRWQFRGVAGGTATVLSSEGESCVNVISSNNQATESCYGESGNEYANAFEAKAQEFGNPDSGMHVFFVESITTPSGVALGIQPEGGRTWLLMSTMGTSGQTGRAETLVHEWGHVMGYEHQTGLACPSTTDDTVNNFMCASSGQLIGPGQCTELFGQAQANSPGPFTSIY